MSDLISRIQDATDWNQRVALLRQIPEQYGTAQHRDIYSEIAESIYVPDLAPDYAHLHWRADYDLPHFREAYEHAAASTDDFQNVDVDTIAGTLGQHPRAVMVFRTILGYIPKELSDSTGRLPDDLDLPKVSENRIKSMETEDRTQELQYRQSLAETVVRLMDGRLWPGDPSSPMRRKQNKPDTADGWDQVRELATDGVPYSWFLHQRHYGGAFRQLLDATSGRRGDLLEEAVEQLLTDRDVPFERQADEDVLRQRWGITMRPAPDFVMFDGHGTLKAMLESKATNDGGTARDKAARFQRLREEAMRLGGVPVFAVLGGLGWRRTGDALGPVVQACDGRVFTPGTLDDMLAVDPLPALVGLLAT